MITAPTNNPLKSSEISSVLFFTKSNKSFMFFLFGFLRFCFELIPFVFGLLISPIAIPIAYYHARIDSKTGTGYSGCVPYPYPFEGTLFTFYF